MQKKLPYILAIVLPFLVVWPLSVILLPQAQTKLHLWVIGIALFIVIFFAVWRGNYSKRCKRAWRLLSVAMIASALLFWAIDTTRAYLKTKIAQKVIICYTRAYLKTKIAQKVIICYTKNR